MQTDVTRYPAINATDLESPPLAQADTIPSRWYWDPAFDRLDRDAVFARTWQGVGHAAQVREEGQFFCAEVAIALDSAIRLERAQSEALTDALTGAYNRRFLEARLARLEMRLPRPAPPPGVDDGAGDAAAGRQAPVPRQVARIAVEVLSRTELQRVDEDAHHHDVGHPSGGVHQPKVALMQEAHRGDESDAQSGRALVRPPRPDSRPGGELAGGGVAVHSKPCSEPG